MFAQIAEALPPLPLHLHDHWVVKGDDPCSWLELQIHPPPITNFPVGQVAKKNDSELFTPTICQPMAMFPPPKSRRWAGVVVPMPTLPALVAERAAPTAV